MKIDWTHKNIEIRDIRKVNKLYVLAAIIPEIDENKTVVLFVKDSIFEERIKSYFLLDQFHNDILREKILALKWNFYLTKGYYIKINEKEEIIQYPHSPNKWYVSYLEIFGDLGEFPGHLNENCLQ